MESVDRNNMYDVASTYLDASQSMAIQAEYLEQWVVALGGEPMPKLSEAACCHLAKTTSYSLERIKQLFLSNLPANAK